MNFLEVKIQKIKESLQIKIDDEHIFKAPLKDLRKLQEEYLDGEEHKAILGIRSEDISIKEKGDLEMKVILTEVLGSETLVHVDSLGKKPFKLVIKSTDRVCLSHNQTLSIDINKSKIHLFSDDEKEISIFEKEV